MPSALATAPFISQKIKSVAAPLERLLTKQQAADLSALSLGTINNAIAAGELVVIRFGVAVRISPESLRAWWESRASKGTGAAIES